MYWRSPLGSLLILVFLTLQVNIINKSQSIKFIKYVDINANLVNEIHKIIPFT